MAHECHDREDLLRDARALVPRVQVQAKLGCRLVSLFAGFRGESLSVYFGADPVFHFNADGELRRAHVAGRLVKSDHGRLISMERVHTDDAVELRAEQLDDAAQAQLLTDMVDRLAALRAILESRQYKIDGVVPPESDALERLDAWLARHPAPTIAESPRVA
jgi:hypothetical protein